NKLRLFYSNEIDLKSLSLLFNINKDYWFNNQESRLFKLSNDTLFQYKINDLNTGNELNIVHSFHQLNDYYLVNSYGELYKLQNTILRKIIGNKRLYNEYKSDNYNLKYNIDRDGDIWFHNYYSLFLIKNDTVYEFNEQDGIKPNPLCNFIDENNNYWYVTKESVNLVNLNELKKSVNAKTHNPQLHFITINGQKIDFRAFKYHPGLIPDFLYQKYNDMTFDSVSRFFNYPYNLSLPYHLNHLTFYFSSNDWSAPHHLKYQYKLEGLDEAWNTITSEIKADYKNIPPGRYIFKIRAIGRSKKWSNVFEYQFTILPPWWKTWWAYLSYSILSFSGIFIFIRQREKKLLLKQKELEFKISQATQVISKQKELVEAKNREIIDSIKYAERIQHALLAGQKLLDTYLNEYFIFYKPKDLVSGDFYWASLLNNNHFAIMCADSTGHGVPGAIMSILNMSCLDKAVHEKKLILPNEILDFTRQVLIKYLNNDSTEEIKDGMDGALICFDFKQKKLYASSANNPVWILRNKQLIEIPADKIPIGKSDKDNLSFTLHSFDLFTNDMVYLFTDGFQDQFGGPLGKKYKQKNLKDLLTRVSPLPCNLQKELIEEEFNLWKQELEQTDDVTILGIRIS
ncbi:MAG: SpoIIE family protein phosphatase, partial [Bacteroidia bacterium]|nr:SpoIIE family protein phosphatase [Bacteroidia bacterium]